MAFEQIEDLRIVKEAEEIADKIWDEIIAWDYFAKDTVGTTTECIYQGSAETQIQITGILTNQQTIQLTN